MAKREIPQIQVQARQHVGGRYAARLRKDGKLPAVIYGHKKDPVHVVVDAESLNDLLHRNQRLLEVVLDAQREPCLVKEVQWNHLSSQIIHVDLARVDLNERVRVRVRLQLTGEAEGLKESGTFLDHPVAEIEVECVVTEIPESIRVDVTPLKKDETLTVAQVKLPEGVKAITPAETIIAAVRELKEEVVETAVPEGEAAAEPEVIGKKAEEGEGEAGEAAPAKPEKGEKADKGEKK